MTASILTNTSAMIALQTLRETNSMLQEVNNQISSGKRVASAKDNAALFAITEVMESDVAGFKAIEESLSLGSSTIAVGSNATETIGSLLDNIKGKIVAANEENVDRATLQNEIDQLRGQINSIVGAAQFNGLNLLQSEETVSILSSLDRSSSGEVTTGNIEITGRNFTTDAGTAGTGTSGKNASLSGTGVTAGTSTVTFTDSADVLTTGGGGNYLLTVDGVDINVTAQDIIDAGFSAGPTDVTDDELATYLADAVNNLGLQGVTAVADTSAAIAELTISSTSSEAISLTSDASGVDNDGEAAGLTAASLAAVTGQTNTGASIGINLGTDEADAAGETFSVTVGENTFTYTAAGDDADPATTAANAVAAFNQQAADDGLEQFVFEVDGTTATQINLINLDSTQGYDVAFDASGLGTSGATSQSAPSVAAAAAGATNVDIAGNVIEGDSFSVTIGSTTATYVAGKNEDANDVIRGLQNVIAADGPAGINTSISFASDPETGVATLSITSETGATVDLTEARGGTQSTGDLYGLSNLDVTTAEGAQKALGTIENLIQTTVEAQAEFGASEQRVELQNDFMSSLIDSFEAGIGALVDADLEEASARLQALQVQQQLSTQALSIANQQPQNLLALFR